jgi:hypothetical protein
MEGRGKDLASSGCWKREHWCDQAEFKCRIKVFRASNHAAIWSLRHTSEAGGLGIVFPTLLDTADSDIACAFDSRDERVLWPNLLCMPLPDEPDSHSKPPRFESLAPPPFERIVEIPGAVLANEGDDPSRRTWFRV